jgi:hypothetical protein
MRRDLEDFPVRFEDCYVCTQPTGGAAMQSRKTFFEQVSYCRSRDSSQAGCSPCTGAGENTCVSPGDRAPNRRGVFKATGKQSFQRETMRKMIWVKSEHSELWSCSRCAWAFNPSGPPRGTSLDEMMQNFERQRDQEFASYVCADYREPRAKEGKSESRFRQKSDDLE